jgi:putative FmdB family regulatory protein
MPLYDYTCAQCGKISEVRHGFNERFDDPCPACGGLLRRVFNPAPIVFKGSGFYVTDSRKGRRSGSEAPAETAEKPAAAKAEPPKEPCAPPATGKTSEAKASESKTSESKASESKAADSAA